jgi:homoprotocatechuate degradation regulator HpaR
MKEAVVEGTVPDMINMLNENGNREPMLCCGAAEQSLDGTVAAMAGKKSVDDRGSAGPRRKVPMRDFSRSLPMALLRARESVMRHFRPSLRGHGLTEQQWRILRALASSGDIEVTELARLAYLLGPSLSRILRDLESRHLIARRVVKADQRRSIVSITRAGLRLIEAVAPTSEAIYAEMTRRFGAGKLGELQDMLHRLESSLQGMPVVGDDGAGNESVPFPEK